MKESSISMKGLHHHQSLLRHFINGRWQKTQVPWSSLRRHKRRSAAKWKHSQWVVDLLTLDSVRPGDRHEIAQPRPVRPLRPSHVTPSCRCDIHLRMVTQHSQPPLSDTVALSCRANRHKKTTTRQPTLCCTPTSLEKYVGSPHRRADLLGQMQTFPLLKWMYGGPWEIFSVHPLPPTSMHIILILCNRQVGSRLYHRSSSSLHAATTGALRWRRLCYRRGPRSQSAALMERQGRGLATRSGDKVVQDSVTVDSVGVVLGILSQLLLVRKSSSLFCLENMSYMT